MIVDSASMENAAALRIAEDMCVAARTAPKAKGLDFILTSLVTGEDKETLAAAMDEMADEFDAAFFSRDARNVEASQAVVLLGVHPAYRALNAVCGYCHNASCADCQAHDGVCAFDSIDLGIAIGSAVAVAADRRVDTRVMFSAGRAALRLGYFDGKASMIFAIPVSVSGKSPFFDRK